MPEITGRYADGKVNPLIEGIRCKHHEFARRWLYHRRVITDTEKDAGSGQLAAGDDINDSSLVQARQGLAPVPAGIEFLDNRAIAPQRVTGVQVGRAPL
jgi:hypothetical protein